MAGPVFFRLPSSPGTLLALGFAALFTSGCATAWARGRVLDAAGSPVPGAELAVARVGSTAVAARSTSDSHGCFNVIGTATRHDSAFVLTVSARGYAPARTVFQKGKPLTAVATLVPDGAIGASALTPVPESALPALYDAPCVPPAIPGASSIGLR